MIAAAWIALFAPAAAVLAIALAVMVVAAAEAVVGLGLIVAMSRQKVVHDVDRLTSLRG